MKFFRKSAVALLLAVIVVPVSLLLNTGIRLTRESQQLLESFYTDSEVYGKSPSYYINSRISDAASLATVGSHYEELTEETEMLRLARSTLVAAYESGYIYGMARANDELTKAVGLFAQTAETVNFTEMDAANYTDRIQALAGAQRNLDNHSYNDRVEAFSRQIHSNPLAALVRVDIPDLFQ